MLELITIFETSSKKDVKYSVECTKLTVVDNSWASKKIDIDKSSSNKDFSYKVTTIENQTGGSSSSSTGSSTGSSGSSSKGSGSSSDKSSDNKASANKDNSDKNTTDEEEKIDEETSLEEDLNSNISDSTIISDSTTTNQSTSTLEEETDTKKLNLGLIIGGTLGGVALLSGACFAVVKNKRY